MGLEGEDWGMSNHYGGKDWVSLKESRVLVAEGALLICSKLILCDPPVVVETLCFELFKHRMYVLIIFFMLAP